MSNYQSRRAFGTGFTSDPAPNIPVVCPTCQSPSIATTAKTPNADSYWRCAQCGEIWNASRHHVRIDRYRF